MRAAAVALALAGAPLARAGSALTLDEALAIAARHSPDLAVARADAESAAADRTASIAGLLPRLDLQTSFGHDFVGPAAPKELVLSGIPIPVGGGPASDQKDYALSLNLTQPVLDWRAFQEVSRAGHGARAADRQVDETVLSVAFDVTRRFYEAVRADRTLAVLEKTAARSQDLVARADALFAAGRAPNPVASASPRTTSIPTTADAP